VLNKNVLSMVDGLVALKLTSSQDRAAIGAWIEGQADREQGKQILGSLPAMQQGQGVVWVPARGILETASFPTKSTFDSSRTPTRGERQQRKELKPVNLEKLKGRLASIEEETKANDPRALKAEVARLTKALNQALAAMKGQAPAWPDQREIVATLTAELLECSTAMQRLTASAKELQRRQAKALAALSGDEIAVPEPPQRRIAPPPAPAQRQPAPPPVRQPQPAREPSEGITGPQQRILDALAWWRAFGIEQPTNEQVAFIAGYSPNSGGFNNLKGGLRTYGFVDYPQPGRIALTEAGTEKVAAPTLEVTQDAFHAQVRAKLSGPQLRVFDPVLAAYPDNIASATVADAAGYTANSGGFNNLRGSLRTLGLIDYPSPGNVRAADWLFP
jgi:uncharacterized protein